jgi:pyruvate dehydrogenase E2 component (dihydrolipoamide acetyltransferase)
MTVVRMPEVATGTGSASIQTWLVGVGDSVSAGQPIAEIETEKAVVEYETEVEGVFAGTLVAAGEDAEVGTPIAVIAVGGEDIETVMEQARVATGAAESTSHEAGANNAQLEEAPSVDEPQAEPAAHHDHRPRQFASPLVRRLAREQGIDLTGAVGTGPNGRIVRRDLESLRGGQEPTLVDARGATEQPTPSEPARGLVQEPIVPARGSSYVDIPHTGMRRAVARRLSESKSTVPHYYLTADCRVDALLDLRAQLNEAGTVKISVNDLVVKATAWALMEVPEANATWGEDSVRRYDHADLAVAVALPSGLVTPVLRGVDQMSVSEVSMAIRDLAGRARDGRLKQHELEGGAFSISNLGMYGVDQFAAIINPPHAGILACGSASPRPVVTADGEIRAATVMTVTLSADHRVIDGAMAAQWLAAFTKRIENPLSIII